MIYTVQPGDTVWDLSRKYSVPMDQIIYVNQLADPNFLSVGQSLLLAPSRHPDSLSIAVNGFAYPYISPWVLGQTLPFFNLLSVFSYGFTPEGTLIPPLLNDGWMVRQALSSGAGASLVLTPLGPDGLFSNILASSLLNSVPAQERLLNQITKTMAEKGYQDLNIDFEYIFAADRLAFPAFVRRAAEFLHPMGYTVSVDLAPKTSADQPGLLYEGKDYRLLGEAADRVLLMTYEWGYKYGPPMAVAPIDQVQRVVEYALTEIPKEKISLGLPNYGYDWPLPFVKGQTAARTIGLVEALQIAREGHAEIQFDETAQSPWFQYTRAGIPHVVWFEDVRSWQAKFDLIREYGLTGIGIWNIMQLFRAGMELIGSNFGVEL